MQNDFSDIVNKILDTSFHSSSHNAILNGVQLALNLGKADANYTYPAFKYLLNILEKSEIKNILAASEEKFRKTLHDLMIESFINPHLEHGIALPENFSELFNYFSKDIFKPDINSNTLEAAKYRRHLRFLRSSMYQSETLFNNMLDIVKNNPEYLKIEEPKLFFNLLEQTFNNYYSYIKEKDKNAILNRRLTYYLHEKAYEPLSIKLNYEDKINELPIGIIFNQNNSLSHLQKLLNCVIEPNEEHLKVNSLYARSKTNDFKVCNRILNNIESIAPLEFYLEMSSFLKVNYMKLFTIGNVLNKFTSRANYVSFATICANSTENYNTNVIAHTGSRWLKPNSDEDQVEIFEHFNDYEQCNKLLNRLYQDFIISPHRDDLRISLLSHLDKNCLLQGLDYLSKNNNETIEILKSLPKNQIIYLNSLDYDNNIANISHLLFAYQENPIVVFHAIKLQCLDNILNNKKTKKYICTNDELKLADKEAYEIIEKIANTFSDIKAYLCDLRISPSLLNSADNPSYLSKNDSTFIPLSYNQPPQQYSSSEINSFYNAYSYFLLENKIGNNNKSIVKKNKI